MANEGVVYVLTNPAMPDMVKIGKTGRGVETRLNDLYSTGVPLPFECSYAARVADMDRVERAFHNAFGPYRVNPKREFFSIEPEQAIGLLELLATADVTPEAQQEAASVDVEASAAAQKIKSRRRGPRSLFSYGIPEGAVLQFRDGQTCRVVAEREVEFEGQVSCLSPLTRRLLGYERNVWPAPYWSYEGQTLADLFAQIDSEDEL